MCSFNNCPYMSLYFIQVLHLRADKLIKNLPSAKLTVNSKKLQGPLVLTVDFLALNSLHSKLLS